MSRRFLFKAVTGLASRQACSAVAGRVAVAFLWLGLGARLAAATPVSVTAGTFSANSNGVTQTVVGPAIANGLLVVRAIVGTSGGTGAGLVLGVSYGASALTLAYAVTATVSGTNGPKADFETWYLTGTASGSNTLKASFSNFYNYNLSYVFYQGADMNAPLGGARFANPPQTGGTTYTSNLTTTRANSLISDFMLAGWWGANAAVGLSYAAQVQEYGTGGGNGPIDIFGDDMPCAAPGPYALGYFIPANGGYIWSTQSLEILAPATPTQTFTDSPTATNTP
ncbi:MAG TPA: hypothetical protein VNZ67_04475, partial [bacterium]|nr:hypothetical protein [bacterium]